MNWVVIVTVAIPAIGILIGVYQIFILERRRLHSGVSDVHTISEPNRLQNSTIVVRHKEVEYTDYIYICNVFFKNSGNRDISANEFQHPVSIELPTDVSIIDHQIDDTHNSKVTSEQKEGSIEIKWAILKPRERIKVSIILSSKDKLDPAEFEKSIVLDDRLINVSNSKPSAYRDYYIASLASILLVGFVAAIFWYDSPIYRARDHSLVYNINNTPHLLMAISNPENLRACEIFTAPRIFEHCQKIDRIDAAHLEVPNPPLKGYSGIPPASILVFLITPLMYAASPFYVVYARRRRKKVRARTLLKL